MKVIFALNKILAFSGFKLLILQSSSNSSWTPILKRWFMRLNKIDKPFHQSLSQKHCNIPLESAACICNPWMSPRVISYSLEIEFKGFSCRMSWSIRAL